MSDPNVPSRWNQTSSMPDEIDPAFRSFAAEGIEAVILPGESLFLSERKRIAPLATVSRLPIMSTWRELAYDGCLMSYGTSNYENWRREAAFVDKILKGEKPGDLPLEFPTRVDLVINLKTAKSLGLIVPPTLLAQADEVIESNVDFRCWFIAEAAARLAEVRLAVYSAPATLGDFPICSMHVGGYLVPRKCLGIL